MMRSSTTCLLTRVRDTNLATAWSVVAWIELMQLQLHVDPRTLKALDDRGIAVHVAETTDAVRIYNELATTQPVGGLFHSTC